MPVLWRGTQAEVGITGLFWIRLSSGPVFHSKSGPLCHPAHRRVMLSQQDILPPQHHPHPASTRRPFIPRKGTKLICFYTYQHIGSYSELWSWWVVDHKCYLRWAAETTLPGVGEGTLSWPDITFFSVTFKNHICFPHLWLLYAKAIWGNRQNNISSPIQ